MRPTVAQPPSGVTPIHERVARIDRILFAPRHWFALDADNRRVMPVADLDHGLGLIGDEGGVQTVVGALRAEVAVVDVDLEGPAGDQVTDEIVGWCKREGAWHIVRPSGGADGKHHVFLDQQGREKAVAALVRGLRAKYHAPPAKIDLRRDIRPLSAPHRSGVTTTPYGARDALIDLLALPWVSKAARRAARSRSRDVAPLVPRPRTRRPLPAEWQRFLDTGIRPRLVTADQSRSTYELRATTEMIWAGLGYEEAWQAVLAAHSMSKARSSKARWTRSVWNPAVQESNAVPAPRDVAVDMAVAEARQRLHERVWVLEDRQRIAVRLVGDTVLDRMVRTGSLRVPVPERDLLLDTGIKDRKTIRKALRLLSPYVGQLHTDAFDPVGKRASSSFEFEVPSARGVLVLPPPSSHTPQPPLPEGCPQSCPVLLRSLLELGPSDLATVAEQAQMTSAPGVPPTAQQRRTIREALLELVRLGLAWCTSGGVWSARDAMTAAARSAGQVRRAAAAVVVEAERVAYRAQRPGAWAAAQALALRQMRARQRAWWESLASQPHPHFAGTQQDLRRKRLEDAFTKLSVDDKRRLKDRLCRRDVRTGVDVRRRHRDWVNQLSSDRLAQRAAWYEALPQPEKASYVQAWQEHRDRFKLPRGTQWTELAVAEPSRASIEQLYLELHDAPRSARQTA